MSKDWLEEGGGLGKKQQPGGGAEDFTLLYVFFKENSQNQIQFPLLVPELRNNKKTKLHVHSGRLIQMVYQ